MIGFAQIAGGAPSSVSAMSKHLLNQTLPEEQLRIAAYYRRGLVSYQQQLIAHVEAWMEGRQPPDLNKVAEYCFLSDATLDPLEFEEIIHAEFEIAIDTAERDGLPALSPEARALHGLPDPIEPPDHLKGLSVDELRQRQDQMMALWDEALGTASYKADLTEQGIHDDAPLAVVRPDLHPAVAIGLGISTTRKLGMDEINALLAGRRADGAFIEGKKYAVERQMPVNPKTEERRWSTPIGSYDFCPTPDKSVSVAWAFANNIEQAQIYNAHIEAAREAVAYIGAEVGQARIGKGGADGYEPGHVGWLEFTHHTSRRTMVSVKDGAVKVEQEEGIPGDPDLHTHFLIPNAVFCDSGRVGSLDSAAIRGFIFEADGYYHARLAQKLREAGFEVDLDERTGAARMSVVPNDVRTLFSKRTNAGEALARKYTADRGEAWDDLTDDQRADRMKVATQSLDQKVKGGKDDVADFKDWQRQAKALGWEPQSLQLYGPPLPPLEREHRHRIAYETGLPWLAKKLEHKAVIPHWDLRLAALRGLIKTGMDDLHDIGGVTKIMREDGVLQYGTKTALVWGQEDGRHYTSITTALHENHEREFVALAKAAAADRSGSIPPPLLKAKIAQFGLDFSDAHGRTQLLAMERIAEGGRFSVAIGTAGSGKTAMLTPLVAAWKEQNRQVIGASLAWRQADELVNAGIDSSEVKAFSVLIDGLRDGGIEVTKNTVVAIDEWGLLGSRQALELLRMREKYGFTVVALGDDKQCGSIEAGAIISLSRRALGTDQVPEILTTRRQQTEREREIVGLLREGRAAEALTMKRADGTAEMVFGGRDGVIKRAAQLYAERLAATGEAPTISAPTNSDTHQLGEAVRSERRKLGLVGPDLFTIRATDGDRKYILRLAKGDRIRLFKSTSAEGTDGKRRSIGRNGSVVEVLEVNKDGTRLRTVSGKTGFVRWRDMALKDGRFMLAYGDASTIHTSQGSTATEHILALPSGSKAVSGAEGYTASTRHRSVSYMLTNEAAERIAVRESRPLNDVHEITIDDTWANVAKNFVTQKKSDSALDLLDRVNGLRRGAVRAFHHAVRPADPRRPDRPTHAPDVAQRRKLDIGLVVARRAMEMAKGVQTGWSIAR
jgi:conjugative relaxase-like TrwC/TraI family protein